MVISKTPFRMSFFGGGTDYKDYYEKYGGTVISTAFDKYCFVTVRDMSRYFDWKNQLTYSRIERFDTPEEVSHPLVRETMRYLKENGLQITYDSDLPAKSGIGSSSSFAVGLLNSIHALRGLNPNPYTLAKEAIYVERELCSESGGIQDQIAAAYGGFNRIDFDAGGFYVHPLNISYERSCRLNDRLMLFFSGIGRYSWEIAGEQSSRIHENTAILHEMKKLAGDAEKILLSSGSLDDFGLLLHEEWRLKTGLASNITTEKISEIYETARKNGALGGKLLGAGGGGFLIFYVPENKREKVLNALKDYMYVPFKFEQSGSKIIYRQ